MELLFDIAGSRCDDRDCNGLLRPNVVFFGETLDSHILTKVEKEIETSDLCLVVSYLHFNIHIGICERLNLKWCSSQLKLPLVGAHCSLFSYRWAHLPLFTQQPCLAPGLHPEVFQWRSLICIQRQNQNISRKSAK